MKINVIEDEHRKSFGARIAPIVKSLCSYIVPRARLFPWQQVQNVPHNPPFDSPAARITGALRRYAEQIAVPGELLTEAEASPDSAKGDLERRVIQELVEKEIQEYERTADFAAEASPWRIATHTLVLERLGYEAGDLDSVEHSHFESGDLFESTLRLERTESMH